MTLPRLMLVTDSTLGGPGPSTGAALAAAGAGLPILVQLREPTLDPAAREDLARRLRDELPGDSPLVVNTDAPLAARVGAGLHLPARVERPPSPPRLLGRSVHDARELARAHDDGCAYAVVGPVFETTSKPGVRPLGCDGLARLASATRIPLYAIGGLDVTRVAAVLAAGAHGVAVRSAVLLAADPAGAVRALGRALDAAARPAGRAV